MVHAPYSMKHHTLNRTRCIYMYPVAHANPATLSHPFCCAVGLGLSSFSGDLWIARSSACLSNGVRGFYGRDSYSSSSSSSSSSSLLSVLSGQQSRVSCRMAGAVEVESRV